MQIKDIIKHLDNREKEKLGQIVRFVFVGSVATLIQYGTYLLMLNWMNVGIANTIGYVVSFLFNFYGSTHFTFKVKANAKRGIGFALSHVINYLMQMGTLTLFVWLGIPHKLAPIPMFCICIPTNFILVRFFLTGRGEK